MVKRQPKGSSRGGQFVSDHSGARRVPTVRKPVPGAFPVKFDSANVPGPILSGVSKIARLFVNSAPVSSDEHDLGALMDLASDAATEANYYALCAKIVAAERRLNLFPWSSWNAALDELPGLRERRDRAREALAANPPSGVLMDSQDDVFPNLQKDYYAARAKVIEARGGTLEAKEEARAAAALIGPRYDLARAARTHRLKDAAKRLG